MYTSSNFPPVVHVTIRTDSSTREMDHGWRAEVTRAYTSIWPSIIRELEDVDVVTFVGVIDGHQPRTCVSRDPKLHGDDTTRFLCIKGEEFRKVELYNAWSKTADSEGIGTHVEDCSRYVTETR